MADVHQVWTLVLAGFDQEVPRRKEPDKVTSHPLGGEDGAVGAAPREDRRTRRFSKLKPGWRVDTRVKRDFSVEAVDRQSGKVSRRQTGGGLERDSYAQPRPFDTRADRGAHPRCPPCVEAGPVRGQSVEASRIRSRLIAAAGSPSTAF